MALSCIPISYALICSRAVTILLVHVIGSMPMLGDEPWHPLPFMSNVKKSADGAEGVSYDKSTLPV